MWLMNCTRSVERWCASSKARAAARLCGLPSGKCSGRRTFCGSLLDGSIASLFRLWKPAGQFSLARVGVQLDIAHSLERLPERRILDLHTLARFALGAVRQLLRCPNIAFERLRCERFRDGLRIGAALGVAGNGSPKHFPAGLRKRGERGPPPRMPTTAQKKTPTRYSSRYSRNKGIQSIPVSY